MLFDDLLSDNRFRSIGSVNFNKKQRTWAIWAREDCTAWDLSVLLQFGIDCVSDVGTTPGYAIRGTDWRHYVDSRGVPRASYRAAVPVGDAVVEEAFELPESLADMPGLSEFRDDRLNAAEGA